MDPILVQNDIIQFLQANILSKSVEIHPEKSLRELGIDSFSIVEIILFIERKYGYIIPDELLLPDNFKTVQSIAQLVANH